ncbi:MULTISPECIES: ABC transporter permease [unclassified Achromobacter]|uniref:ABC transporter permease n=1 Tax=unclassified Achromobacter TaxID=2626865 RepID=UPI000B51B981|nr:MULTISPECIES: FtsX-like permease family protein [unclassified Achromobacter]OWT70143.1 ABC transporter permease [Achromobacter sp. HZ34]OWT71682.1 ABC transporter permease [Achromobacter sp. HZ28]
MPESSAAARFPAARPVATRGLLHPLRLGVRALLRDTRAGELRLLVIALIVAVAAVTSVGFLADRVGRALERDAAQMLGADVVLDSDSPLPPAFEQRALQEGLRLAHTWQFPSMAGAGDNAQLVSLKAVEPGYPLRGSLRTAQAPFGADAPTRDVPDRGTVWVDPQLLGMLNVAVGGTLTLGDAQFRIARVVTYEPDRSLQFVNVSPRVMMRADDLAATHLIAPGSRVGYALLAAGEAPAVAAYSTWLTANLQRGQKIATVESGRPDVRRVLDRAQRFLSLVALLAVLISAVAVALAANRFMQRHRDGVAVMRCLGAPQSAITRMLTVEFILVGVLASLAGGVAGYAVHEGLVQVLARLIDTPLPTPSVLPAAQGLATGLWLLLGFALPSLAQLRHVPPARVLRRDDTGLQAGSVVGYIIGAAGFALLIWWFAGNARLGGIIAGGFLGAFAVFALLAGLCVALLARVRHAAAGMPALRFALAGVTRRRAATITQVCALAIGLMALLLLAMTRTDLIAGWQRTLPADAPNRFLINIQPDQRAAVATRLTQGGVGQADLYPMIRGRLVSINGRAVSAADYEDGRAKRLVDREFNLSYADKMPTYNRLAEGRWMAPASREVSMESGIATTLGVKMGDKLAFDIAGQTVEADVTSLRTVDWDTMRVNFFAMLSPSALADAPQSWITSFHLPDDKPQLLPQLVRDYPNLTVFDVGAILKQLQTVLDQVVQAVQLLFVFTLAAGVLVLAAALTATRDERVREAAVLRALGATRRQLARAQRLELLAVGGLAGLLGAAGAAAVAWALSRFVFDFTITLSLWPWLAGIAAGMLGAWGGGALALRGVLRTPPLVTLREAL